MTLTTQSSSFVTERKAQETADFEAERAKTVENDGFEQVLIDMLSSIQTTAAKFEHADSSGFVRGYAIGRKNAAADVLKRYRRFKDEQIEIDTTNEQETA